MLPNSDTSKRGRKLLPCACIVFARAATSSINDACQRDADSLRCQVRTYARELTHASSPIDAYTASRALFAIATDQELAELRKRSDDGIALRAAWEAFRRTLPISDQEDTPNLDERRLHRFLGFTEARLRVSAPEWWEHAVL